MNDDARLVVPINDEDHRKGRLDAPIQLVEYGDFECPYCGLAYPIVKEVERQYGRMMCFAFRQFPLPQHPHAYGAATASEYAGDYRRFWEMHDTLFENQRALAIPNLLAYAEQLELDPEGLVAALRDGTYLPVIEGDKESGIESGVQGTPTFYLNNVRFDAEPTLDNFAAAIEELLSRV
ncbi:MAG TPA: thioredoxin domain-containing protein [Candidatus Elarobacter sp.]|jgi:protein-disulfide isomerase